MDGLVQSDAVVIVSFVVFLEFQSLCLITRLVLMLLCVSCHVIDLWTWFDGRVEVDILLTCNLNLFVNPAAEWLRE